MHILCRCIKVAMPFNSLDVNQERSKRVERNAEMLAVSSFRCYITNNSWVLHYISMNNKNFSAWFYRMLSDDSRLVALCILWISLLFSIVVVFVLFIALLILSLPLMSIAIHSIVDLSTHCCCCCRCYCTPSLSSSLLSAALSYFYAHRTLFFHSKYRRTHTHR